MVLKKTIAFLLSQENKVYENDYYPKWIFHKTETPKIVQTREEHEQAGKDWKETPFAENKEQVQTPDESQTSEDEANENSESENTEIKKEKPAKNKKAK